MKNKFLILTLCFTIVFTSINYKKSYAFDMGVVSVPMLATLGTLAVGSGIVLSSNDDLYDLGRLFYDKHKDNWENVETVFKSCVFMAGNQVVTVGKEFLDICKETFDLMFNTYEGTSTPVDFGSIMGVSKYPGYTLTPAGSFVNDYFNVYTDDKGLHINYSYNGYEYSNLVGVYDMERIAIESISGGFKLYAYTLTNRGVRHWYGMNIYYPITDVVSIPNVGDYNWDNIGSKENDESVDIYVPGNLGDLVGTLPGDVVFGDVFNPPYELPNNGSVSIPNVDNPSIGTTDDVFVGNPSIDVPGDIPSDTPFSNITEYIISLVVPSDSYWTDTFGGLYNNFTNSFPLVDMSKFNDLVTGEKKFPNIDINIMGVKGRVVNGDVINSIVDWLRPIVAGFMMLCLMLFNYRKIYKTIRGVEPFNGVAQGTSDFRTGISEYNYMGTGLSKADYDANQMELAKALYDYEQDTGKTYKIKI